MAPMPGQDGAAKGTLGGGEGYFFKKGLTPDQIKAGLKWIAYEKLTPGKGQFDYARAKPQNYPVGLPQPLLFAAAATRRSRSSSCGRRTRTSTRRTSRSSRRPRSRSRVEPANAQAIYAVLDGAMSAVLTNPNANIDELLKTAEDEGQPAPRRRVADRSCGGRDADPAPTPLAPRLDVTDSPRSCHGDHHRPGDPQETGPARRRRTRRGRSARASAARYGTTSPGTRS